LSDSFLESSTILPFREQKYPTRGKGTSSSTVPSKFVKADVMLVPSKLLRKQTNAIFLEE